MQSLRIQTVNRPLSEREIDQLEDKLEMRLPKSYRDFLKAYNGGIPYHNTFDVSAGEEQKHLYSFAIRKFLGLNSRGHDDIIRTRYSLRHQLPENFLPIAIDKFRNFMCLSLATGEVFFFDLQSAIQHEGRIKENPLERFLYPVAEDFEQLLDRLYHKSFS